MEAPGQPAAPAAPFLEAKAAAMAAAAMAAWAAVEEAMLTVVVAQRVARQVARTAAVEEVMAPAAKVLAAAAVTVVEILVVAASAQVVEGDWALGKEATAKLAVAKMVAASAKAYVCVVGAAVEPAVSTKEASMLISTGNQGPGHASSSEPCGALKQNAADSHNYVWPCRVSAPMVRPPNATSSDEQRRAATSSDEQRRAATSSD